MPCFSVAVEDGQPAQAPRMFRIDDAVAETLEGDVAAILRDRRANAGLDQFLDGLRPSPVGRVEESSVAGGSAAPSAEHRRAGQVMLHDRAEDRGLDVLPLGLVLGHGDEVMAEEHAGDALDAEDALGERRALPRRRAEVARALRRAQRGPG